MNCTVCFLKPKHLSGGGPWLSVCRNVILSCPLPLARTGHNALTVYFCTTCTERNISCKRAPTILHVTMYNAVRGASISVDSPLLEINSVKLQITLWCSDICTQLDFSCFISLFSHLLGLWLVNICQYWPLIGSPESLRMIPGRNEGRAGCKNMSVWPELTNERPELRHPDQWEAL